MGTTYLIAARVSSETKARFCSLAEKQQMTESALLKRLVDLAIRGAGATEADVLKAPERRLRGARLCVRLHPDDQLLLAERAAARQMPAATYVSVLVRAHLRTLSPLPKAELMELRRIVAALGAIGRNVNQMARLAHQRPGSPGPGREEVQMMLKICEATRNHTKQLIKANEHSWETGHANDPT